MSLSTHKANGKSHKKHKKKELNNTEIHSKISLLSDGKYRKGWLFTCDRHRQKQAIRDAYNFLTDYITILYGELVEQNIQKKLSLEEKESTIQREAEELSKSQNQLLRSIKTRVNCIIFIQINPLYPMVDPVEVTMAIMADMKEGMMITRYCHHITPAQRMLKAEYHGLVNTLQQLFSQKIAFENHLKEKSGLMNENELHQKKYSQNQNQASNQKCSITKQINAEIKQMGKGTQLFALDNITKSGVQKTKQINQDNQGKDTEAKQKCIHSWALQFKCRNNSKFNYKEILRETSKIASSYGYFVDIYYPQWTVLIEIVNHMMCIAIVEQYKECGQFKLRKKDPKIEAKVQKKSTQEKEKASENKVLGWNQIMAYEDQDVDVI